MYGISQSRDSIAGSPLLLLLIKWIKPHLFVNASPLGTSPSSLSSAPSIVVSAKRSVIRLIKSKKKRERLELWIRGSP